jgi:hypothetical protein
MIQTRRGEGYRYYRRVDINKLFAAQNNADIMHSIRSGRGTKSLERPTSTELRVGKWVEVRDYAGTSSERIML